MSSSATLFKSLTRKDILPLTGTFIIVAALASGIIDKVLAANGIKQDTCSMDMRTTLQPATTCPPYETLTP